MPKLTMLGTLSFLTSVHSSGGQRVFLPGMASIRRRCVPLLGHQRGGQVARRALTLAQLGRAVWNDCFGLVVSPPQYMLSYE